MTSRFSCGFSKAFSITYSPPPLRKRRNLGTRSWLLWCIPVTPALHKLKVDEFKTTLPPKKKERVKERREGGGRMEGRGEGWKERGRGRIEERGRKEGVRGRMKE